MNTIENYAREVHPLFVENNWCWGVSLDRHIPTIDEIEMKIRVYASCAARELRDHPDQKISYASSGRLMITGTRTEITGEIEYLFSLWFGHIETKEAGI